MGQPPNDRRSQPRMFHSTLALAMTIGVAALLLHSLGWPADRWVWLGAWFIAVNGIALGYYGFDKMQAQRDGRRVPEIVLHGLVVAGGGPGAFLAMRWFRHKTVKGRFRLVFWLIVLTQAALSAALVYRLWLGRMTLPS